MLLIKTCFSWLFLTEIKKNLAFDYNAYGDIHLQDSTFSYDDFVLFLNGLDEDIKKSNTSTTLYLASRITDTNRNWKNIEKLNANLHLVSVPVSVPASVNLNGVTSDEQLDSKQSATISQSPFSETLLSLEKFFNEKPIDQLMETSKFTGTLKISKPVLYIFPGREGDSAYFTMNGYSMLINGGYDRIRPCFWKFVNMLQQIDSVLITHTDSDVLGGLSSFFQKN